MLLNTATGITPTIDAEVKPRVAASTEGREVDFLCICFFFFFGFPWFVRGMLMSMSDQR